MCNHCSAHDWDHAIEAAAADGDWILDREDLRRVVAFSRYATSPEEFLEQLLTAGWQPRHARELALLLTHERESVVSAGTP